MNIIYFIFDYPWVISRRCSLLPPSGVWLQQSPPTKPLSQWRTYIPADLQCSLFKLSSPPNQYDDNWWRYASYYEKKPTQHFPTPHVRNPTALHLRHPSMHIRWSSPPAARNFSCSEVPLQRNPIWSHCEEWRPTPTSRRPVAPAANALRPKLELKSLLRGSFDPGGGESFKHGEVDHKLMGKINLNLPNGIIHFF